jgi:hypothetical protein
MELDREHRGAARRRHAPRASAGREGEREVMSAPSSVSPGGTDSVGSSCQAAQALEAHG